MKKWTKEEIKKAFCDNVRFYPTDLSHARPTKTGLDIQHIDLSGVDFSILRETDEKEGINDETSNKPRD